MTCITCTPISETHFTTKTYHTCLDKYEVNYTITDDNVSITIPTQKRETIYLPNQRKNYMK